ncbi:MAG: acetyl-CoA carboxylase carboxyl transferase subunit alpha, partial [Elusimicrobiota bacterium]
SVSSPEGCASILWRSADKAADAAEAMGITADSLSRLGLIDEIVPEPLGGAHRDRLAIVGAFDPRSLHTSRIARSTCRLVVS